MVQEAIYEAKVDVPDNVDVKIEGMKVIAKGPKGILEKDFSFAKGIELVKENKKIIVRAYFPKRRTKALVGTIKAHIRNMIIGVTKGYRYKLKIIFSHFPVSVKVQGDKIIIENFLGEKAPRIAKVVGNVNVKVESDDIIVEGIDIEAVGQTAANIELATKISEFDRRVFVDGIYIYEKGHMD